jgi:hypothetical protein
VLDLKSKKAELYELQLALDRDAKRAVCAARSERDELLAALADSLVCWLPDVWRVGAEHRTGFALVHSCLMLCAHVLESMTDNRGRCAYTPRPCDAR